MRRAYLVLMFTTGLSACTGVFFQPMSQHVRTPAHIGLPYEDVSFRSGDGTRLHGWYLPARTSVCGTILFLHGNAENISTHIGSVYWLPERGFNVFLPDYRGYGRSEGQPSLAGLQADIDAAMRYLLARPGTDPNKIVVFGQSLGGASALYYVAHSAHRDSIRALVSESAFASHRAIAREKLGAIWLTWAFQYPLSWTIDNEYSPLDAIERITPIPLLLMHGDRDLIVPVSHAEQLFAAARAPKELWRIEGAGHIGALMNEGVRERFVGYLRQRLCPAR